MTLTYNLKLENQCLNVDIKPYNLDTKSFKEDQTVLVSIAANSLIFGGGL